jgi:hypothetical protein
VKKLQVLTAVMAFVGLMGYAYAASNVIEPMKESDFNLKVTDVYGYQYDLHAQVAKGVLSGTAQTPSCGSGSLVGTIQRGFTTPTTYMFVGQVTFDSESPHCVTGYSIRGIWDGYANSGHYFWVNTTSEDNLVFDGYGDSDIWISGTDKGGFTTPVKQPGLK